MLFSDKVNCFASIVLKSCVKPCLQKSANVTSMPRSACTDSICLVLKKPFKYAVAGYGVFSCVNGGVINKTVCPKAIDC